MAAIASGKLPILSEQSIIDCLGSRKPPWGSSDSCIYGGDPASVFRYLKKEKNITINTEFGYPYVSGTTGEV